MPEWTQMWQQEEKVVKKTKDKKLAKETIEFQKARGGRNWVWMEYLVRDPIPFSGTELKVWVYNRPYSSESY